MVSAFPTLVGCGRISPQGQYEPAKNSRYLSGQGGFKLTSLVQNEVTSAKGFQDDRKREQKALQRQRNPDSGEYWSHRASCSGGPFSSAFREYSVSCRHTKTWSDAGHLNDLQPLVQSNEKEACHVPRDSFECGFVRIVHRRQLVHCRTPGLARVIGLLCGGCAFRLSSDLESRTARPF